MNSETEKKGGKSHRLKTRRSSEPLLIDPVNESLGVSSILSPPVEV